MAKKNKSIEPEITELANGWLKSYGLDYKLQQASLNTEIDRALENYFSKSGGKGGNLPDSKLLLLANDGRYYPILLEYKGYKDKLVKVDSEGNIANRTSKGGPDFTNIKNYAVNGAVHYANAILHYTGYTDVIAIGVTGHKDADEKIIHQIGVYYVSRNNFGIGQKVDEYTDLSFLRKEHFSSFIEKVKQLSLPQCDIDRLKERREEEITASLIKLNNDIFKEEKGLSENDRVYLVVASIMATLGDADNHVYPLNRDDLKSSRERNNTDGDIMIRKIESFLEAKDIPKDKKDLIIRTLQNTLTTDNINKPVNGESQLKRVFIKIVDDLGIYYKVGLTTDFTGKLFNEMYSWLGFTQDQLNDVVLTPPYVATMLCKLARVNKDSYVWDFATGSAGLLVAAMNEMLKDAKNTISSPEQLARKSAEIKANQLLGLEILSNVYMLAVLNMIIMGDGSSNILNEDAIKFDGHYGFVKTDEKFPADAFILNPPYSAEGCGMIFVEKALSMMSKGYAAVIIQNTAGSGKAIEYNKKILKNNTLLSSIKMPIDLFIGKSSVQTYIYVFRVGEPHHKDEVVKFIDFSNDGYSRRNRKKSTNNLKDTGDAKARYEEVINLVRFGKSKLNLLTEKEYFEGQIDPNNGADWNQSAPTDSTPTLTDFKKTVADYLSWEVSNLLKNQKVEEDSLGTLNRKLQQVKWGTFKICELFKKIKVQKLTYKVADLPSKPTNEYSLPALTAGIQNQGLNNYIPEYNATILQNVISISANGANTGATFYQSHKFTILQDAYAIEWIGDEKLNDHHYLFFTSAISKAIYGNYEWTNKAGWERIKNEFIKLPILPNGNIDFEFIAEFVAELEAQRVAELEIYLQVAGIKDYKTRRLL